MDRQEYTSANRQAWDETAPVHAKSQMEGLLKNLRNPAHLCLDETAQGLADEGGCTG